MSFNLKTVRRTALSAGIAAVLVIGFFFARSAAFSSLIGIRVEDVSDFVIEKRSLNFSVSATGTLRATSVRNFGGPAEFRNYWQFQIVNIAPEGKAVKKGELLVSFDAQRISQDLQNFESELEQATKESERTKTQNDLDRQDLAAKLAEAENKYEKLKLKQGTGSATEASNKVELDALALEQARREVEALRDRIEWQKKSSEANLKIIASKRARAENKVNEIKRGMENFQTKADRDGVVVYKVKWNGEKFKVGETVWSGQPILEIPDLNTIIAEALVPEVDIGKVKAGQRVEIGIDAFPGKTYSGVVKSVGTLVRPKAWDIPNKVLEVQVALDQLDTSVMRPAMSIKVKIETTTIEDCVAVPLKAVSSTADGSMVKLKSKAGWRRAPVTLGLSNGTDVIVSEGLKPGDRVAADFSKAK